jgi:hypothetical protein
LKNGGKDASRAIICCCSCGVRHRHGSRSCAARHSGWTKRASRLTDRRSDFWRGWAGLQGPTPEKKYCVTVAELASRNQGRRMPAGFGGLRGGHRGLRFAYCCEPAVHQARAGRASRWRTLMADQCSTEATPWGGSDSGRLSLRGDQGEEVRVKDLEQQTGWPR